MQAMGARVAPILKNVLSVSQFVILLGRERNDWRETNDGVVGVDGKLESGTGSFFCRHSGIYT